LGHLTRKNRPRNDL